VVDPIVVGVIFPRRHGAGAVLRAGRLAVLARDGTGAEVEVTLTCLARPGGRGPLRRCRYEHATTVAVDAAGAPIARFDPVRGRLLPLPGADPALVGAVVRALLDIGTSVRPPAPPPRTTLAPHLQVAW
jgi:hypothetical protein